MANHINNGEAVSVFYESPPNIMQCFMRTLFADEYFIFIMAFTVAFLI